MILRGEFSDIDDETGEIIWTPCEDEGEQLEKWNRLLAELPPEDIYYPLTESEIRLDGTPMVIKTETQEMLYVIAMPKMLRISTFRNSDIQNENLVWSSGGYAGEKRHPLENVSVQEDDVKKCTYDIMHSLELQDHFDIACIEKARILAYAPDGFQIASEGMLVELGLTAGYYLPTNYTRYNADNLSRDGNMIEEAYAARWDTDVIQIYIDESGLQDFVWFDPIEYVMTANENVSLLSFDEIQCHIRDYLRYCYSWTDSKDKFHINQIKVKRIVLSCAETQIANQGEEAFLAPTWVVIYSNNVSEEQHNSDFAIIVNAIDGSCQKR